MGDLNEAQLAAEQKYEFCEALVRKAREDPSLSSEERARIYDQRDKALGEVLRVEAALRDPAFVMAVLQRDGDGQPIEREIRLRIGPGPRGESLVGDIDAAMQRALAPASPAPAWTREVPANDGWYFARCAEWKIEPERGRALLWTAENAWHCGWELGCCEEPPEAPIEHWPQRLEPPK